MQTLETVRSDNTCRMWLPDISILFTWTRKLYLWK